MQVILQTISGKQVAVAPADQTAPHKPAVIEALRRFICQRPGLEYGNYGDPVAYRAELRSIAKDRRQALELLRAVEWRDSITAADLARAAEGAFSGRLTIEIDGSKARISYCTGQYFPTEYRCAACAVLARALWHYWRADLPKDTAYAGAQIHKIARDNLGRAVASRWFA